MKYLGVDYSMKYIIFELDGRQYTVQFRDKFIRGTYNISVLKKGREVNAKIVSAYPHLGKRILDMALMTRLKMEWTIKRLLQRNR